MPRAKHLNRIFTKKTASFWEMNPHALRIRDDTSGANAQILCLTSSIKSTFTSAYVPPPSVVPSRQRSTPSARVGTYLPVRALPTIIDLFSPTVMMASKSELIKIGTKQVDSHQRQSKTFEKQEFEFLKAINIFEAASKHYFGYLCNF